MRPCLHSCPLFRRGDVPSVRKLRPDRLEDALYREIRIRCLQLRLFGGELISQPLQLLSRLCYRLTQLLDRRFGVFNASLRELELGLDRVSYPGKFTVGWWEWYSFLI